MSAAQILEELIAILESQGVEVRREPIEESRGGLCRIGGAMVLFIDTAADPVKAAGLCARALSRVVDIHAIFLLPNVREFVESALRDRADHA